MEAEPKISAPDPDPNTAFEAFWSTHYQHCIVMLMAIGATLDDAHDTVGDVIADMLGKSTLARLTNPRAWVRTAVLHRYYDRRGRERLRLKHEFGVQQTTESGLDPGLNTWEDWQWVQQELGRLPPTQRSIFELVMAEFDTKEIAELLGKTPDTVRQNLAHARRRLRADLGRRHPSPAERPAKNQRRKDAS